MTKNEKLSAASRKRTSVLLWIVQGLLAALFLFAGTMKLVVPIQELTKQTPLPGLFLRFIAIAEVLGAIGLILPAWLRIRPVLTPLAATGLAMIMIGATVLTAPAGPVVLIPMLTGALAVFVAYGRFRMVPQGIRPQESERPERNSHLQLNQRNGQLNETD